MTDLTDYEWKHAQQVIASARRPAISFDNAIVYDIETFPNTITFAMECLNNDTRAVWEISQYRDDRRQLIEFYNWLNTTQTVMIGFNNIGFDYPVIHDLFCNPNVSVDQLYQKAMSIINSFGDRNNHTIWADRRFAPQLDLFKLNHFDNPAKSTNLKALQINTRAPSVVDMPVENGKMLTPEEIAGALIPYNFHDVSETKRFAHLCRDAIQFRAGLIPQFGIDVLSWNDTKIGEHMLISRLGNDLCYDYSTGRKTPRQTPRTRVAFNDLIFPYVHFTHPEFNRILNYFRSIVLTAHDIKDIGKENPNIKTKGVFKDLSAMVNGFEFVYGVGGIHGSVSSKKIIATDEWLIRDIDVASLYPSIAIANGVAPAHLGKFFSEVYAEIPRERKEWQKKKGKKCTEANALKLAANGAYGKSNSKYSPLFDPQFMLTITVNGQLMLSMMAEKLMTVPTLSIIQINTDGITYFVHKNHEPQAAAFCKEWESVTRLTLEDANYKRMWIRDVNNYVAESFDGSLKMKGAYWSPDPLRYAESINEQQPPAWHKDLGNCVSVRAAVAAMVQGVDPEIFIKLTRNPYDFMKRVKVNRSDLLVVGDQRQQRNTRYFISRRGGDMVKHSPPTGKMGAFKRKNGVTEHEYNRVMKETGGAWDGRVCTGKASDPKTWGVYKERATAIERGYKVTVCNNVSDFDFENVDYSYYINEAKKLII